jgi:hypothetical protein
VQAMAPSPSRTWKFASTHRLLDMAHLMRWIEHSRHMSLITRPASPNSRRSFKRFIRFALEEIAESHRSNFSGKCATNFTKAELKELEKKK